MATHGSLLVADRGLLSLENISELTSLADQGGRTLAFILAVPTRRYADLVETFQRLTFDDTGLAESTFAGHRLIVAHAPLRAAEQGDRRRTRIAELEAMAEKMVGKLYAQDGGQTAKGRRASDRGAHSRSTHAVTEAESTRFIKADLNADRFSWSVDDDAVAKAELFEGKLALITNAPDLTATDAVARYKDLADIERGFRVLKSDIEIAPVHHRLPDRIRAHALVCFRGLVLYRVMRMRLKAKGHSASPRTALDLLANPTAPGHDRRLLGRGCFHRNLRTVGAFRLPEPARTRLTARV
jgi:transposase